MCCRVSTRLIVRRALGAVNDGTPCAVCTCHQDKLQQYTEQIEAYCAQCQALGATNASIAATDALSETLCKELQQLQLRTDALCCSLPPQQKSQTKRLLQQPPRRPLSATQALSREHATVPSAVLPVDRPPSLRSAGPKCRDAEHRHFWDRQLLEGVVKQQQRGVPPDNPPNRSFITLRNLMPKYEPPPQRVRRKSRAWCTRLPRKYSLEPAKLPL